MENDESKKLHRGGGAEKQPTTISIDSLLTCIIGSLHYSNHIYSQSC